MQAACQPTSDALPVGLASTKQNIFVYLTCRLSHFILRWFLLAFPADILRGLRCPFRGLVARLFLPFSPCSCHRFCTELAFFTAGVVDYVADYNLRMNDAPPHFSRIYYFQYTRIQLAAQRFALLVGRDNVLDQRNHELCTILL